jgi:hypothetical protein
MPGELTIGQPPEHSRPPPQTITTALLLPPFESHDGKGSSELHVLRITHAEVQTRSSATVNVDQSSRADAFPFLVLGVAKARKRARKPDRVGSAMRPALLNAFAASRGQLLDNCCTHDLHQTSGRVGRHRSRARARSFEIGSTSRSRSLVEHDLFGKPVSTHRVKPEGMLFRIMH